MAGRIERSESRQQNNNNNYHTTNGTLHRPEDYIDLEASTTLPRTAPRFSRYTNSSGRRAKKWSERPKDDVTGRYEGDSSSGDNLNKSWPNRCDQKRFVGILDCKKVPLIRVDVGII